MEDKCCKTCVCSSAGYYKDGNHVYITCYSDVSNNEGHELLEDDYCPVYTNVNDYWGSE